MVVLLLVREEGKDWRQVRRCSDQGGRIRILLSCECHRRDRGPDHHLVEVEVLIGGCVCLAFLGQRAGSRRQSCCRLRCLRPFPHLDLWADNQCHRPGCS